MTPSWPRASASSRNACAASSLVVSSLGTTCSAGTRASRIASRSCAGRSIRSSPSTCNRSKKNDDSGVVSGPTAFVPKRLIVTWNASGRPSARNAIASPSRTSEAAAKPRTAAAISGTRSVMSARLRVNTATSSPRRWAWIRAPSSFHSTYGSTTRSSPDGMSFAVCASIGPIGWSGDSRNRDSPSRPSRMATSATVGRSPASMDARRTSAIGNPAALATASAMTPSSAPWRSSPRKSPTNSRCSGSVAREKSWESASRRAACEPAPEIPFSRVIAASTSRTSSDGSAAGARRSLSAAQPTPTVPCGSSPERYDTAIATSSGAAPCRHSVKRATFASRDDVDATSADVAAISASCIPGIQASRECDPDGHAAFPAVRRARRAPVGLRDRPDDREAETGASRAPSRIRAAEALERVREERRRKPRTVVADRQHDATVRRFGGEANRAVTVAQSVVDEDVERLLDAPAIRTEHDVAGSRHPERPTTSCGSRGISARDGVQHRLRTMLGDAKRQLPVVGTRQDEKILREADEALDLLAGRQQGVLQLLRRAGPAGRELELGPQRRQRRAQLVARIRDETSLPLEAGVQPVEHPVQRSSEPVHLVLSPRKGEATVWRVRRDLARSPAHVLHRPQRRSRDEITDDRRHQEGDG